MLRSDHHIGCAVECVGTRRINTQNIIASRLSEFATLSTRFPVRKIRYVDQWEINFRARASTDPIRLQFLDPRRPIQAV